jgi:thymidylate synthase
MDFTVETLQEKSGISNSIQIYNALEKLKNKLENSELIHTGMLANQTDGQNSYVEIKDATFDFDPYEPFISINQDFKTPRIYLTRELEWYKSMDLSIIGHPGIEENPTWNNCCTKDDKKEVNSNYGWCVFSKENGYQYQNALNTLTRDITSRNAVIIYTRPNIHTDMHRNGMHDMICTVFSQFFIRNNRLEMSHFMRSNDIKFGLICSDLAWNCFVYQNMYEDLLKIYPGLKPGKIHWVSTSLHLYSRHYDALRNLSFDKGVSFTEKEKKVMLDAFYSLYNSYNSSLLPQDQDFLERYEKEKNEASLIMNNISNKLGLQK